MARSGRSATQSDLDPLSIGPNLVMVAYQESDS
jgi:hypothetical protein